jgi:hypothetical protein
VLVEIVDCPECGAPAELESWSSLPSTGEQLEHVKVLCIGRHWFLMPRDVLVHRATAARARAEESVQE